jgi:hypothetical protein
MVVKEIRVMGIRVIMEKVMAIRMTVEKNNNLTL